MFVSEGKWKMINSRTANRTSYSEDRNRVNMTSEQLVVFSASSGGVKHVASTGGNSSHTFRHISANAFLANTSPMRAGQYCPFVVSSIAILSKLCLRDCKLRSANTINSELSEKKKHKHRKHDSHFKQHDLRNLENTEVRMKMSEKWGKNVAIYEFLQQNQQVSIYV